MDSNTFQTVSRNRFAYTKKYLDTLGCWYCFAPVGYTDIIDPYDIKYFFDFQPIASFSVYQIMKILANSTCFQRNVQKSERIFCALKSLFWNLQGISFHQMLKLHVQLQVLSLLLNQTQKQPLNQALNQPFKSTIESSSEVTTGTTVKFFETGTEPTTKPTTASSTDPATEPTTASSTDPTTGPITASSADPTTEPTTGLSTDPTTEPTTTSNTDPTTEPTTGSITDPTSVSATHPTIGPATETTAAWKPQSCSKGIRMKCIHETYQNRKETPRLDPSIPLVELIKRKFEEGKRTFQTH